MNKLTIHFISIVGLALLAGPAMGATITWDGDQGNNRWGTANNWVGGAAPVNNDDLVFAGVAIPGQTTANNNINNLTIRSITFNTTLTSNMTLSGNAIRLSSGITNLNTTNTMTMSLGLTLTGAQTFSNAGTLNISSTVNNSGNNLTVNGAGTTTMSGVISGTGQLIKSGTGVLNLNAANTYTGQTLINSGTVRLGNNAGLGGTGAARSTTIASGATLDVNGRSSGETITVSGTGVGGLGAIVNTAAGTGTISGPITLAGNTTIGGTGNLTLSGAMSTAGYYLTNINSGTATISGVISGTGGIIQNSSGILSLNGTNTYTGQTLINSGTVQLGNNSGLGSTAGNTVIASGATLNVNGRAVGAEPVSVTGTGVGGLGAIVNNNTTAASLSGPITMAGNTTIGGTGNLTLSGTLNLSGYNLTNINSRTVTLSGVVSGNGNLIQNNNAGTLTLGNSSNSFTGNILINQGTVAVSADARLGNANNDIVFGALGAGTFQVTNNITLGSGRMLDFSGGAGNLNVSSGRTLTLGTAGQLTGSNAMTLTGAGTVRLSQANTGYSGNVNVNAGTLRIDNASSLGNTTKGLITVNNTGRLQLAGSSTTNFGNEAVVNSGGIITGVGRIGALTINTGGTLNPGALGTSTPYYQVGAMGAGNTIFSGAGNYNWQIYNATGAAGVGYDVLNVTGTLNTAAASGFKINVWSMSSATASGNTTNFNNANNYTWTLVTTTGGIVGFDPSQFQLFLSANNGTSGFTNTLGPSSYFQLAVVGNNLVLNYIAVPEPGTLMLLGLGVLFLVARTRRLKKAFVRI